ncbi:MAG: TCP-1/cpn60 chaperonin family protein, partial [Flavobacteriales bacterium]
RSQGGLDKLDVNAEQKVGTAILLRAIEEPLRQIAANAGLEGSIVVNEVRNGKNAFGFNAATETYEDLVKAGVIDPTKVTRVALENAVSISGMVLTTECVITDIPEETPAPAGPPMGGGMGGGSSDGTYALLAINDVCELGLSRETLLAHAAELGSDCPFFVDSAPAMVTGRGEHVAPLGFELPLDGVWVVVANPGIHISTAEAFGGLTSTDRTTPWDHLATTPLAQWHTLIRNDFESGAVERHPAIGDLLQALRDAGASYVQMTGSGSTVFGLFHDETLARSAGNACGAQFVGPLSA